MKARANLQPDLTAVPRPPAPSPAHQRIDLRTAPSLMEQRAAAWGTRKP